MNKSSNRILLGMLVWTSLAGAKNLSPAATWPGTFWTQIGTYKSTRDWTCPTPAVPETRTVCELYKDVEVRDQTASVVLKKLSPSALVLEGFGGKLNLTRSASPTVFDVNGKAIDLAQLKSHAELREWLVKTVGLKSGAPWAAVAHSALLLSNEADYCGLVENFTRLCTRQSSTLAEIGEFVEARAKKRTNKDIMAQQPLLHDLATYRESIEKLSVESKTRSLRWLEQPARLQTCGCFFQPRECLPKPAGQVRTVSSLQKNTNQCEGTLDKMNQILGTTDSPSLESELQKIRRLMDSFYKDQQI